MTEDVKSESGRRPRRADKARATRRRIVDAAGDLLVQHGYAGTTLEAIAEQAGVAVQTVYFHFGNKRTVLKQVVDLVSVGDDLPVPLLDRPWVKRLQATPDPHEALRIWMRNSRTIFVRVAPIMRIVRDAVGADPEMAQQWTENQQQRLAAHRFLAQQLADKDGLRKGLSVEEAGDVLYTLISLEVFVLMTVDRGWTPRRWQRWVTTTVAEAVLHPAGDPAGTG
jgi:AcrR family transcriptional regulator